VALCLALAACAMSRVALLGDEGGGSVGAVAVFVNPLFSRDDLVARIRELIK